MLGRLVFLVAIAASATLNSGCSTLADARAARGSGTARIYEAPHSLVWEILPGVLKDVGLDLAGDNKQENYILAQRGVTLFSMGEQVAIYVEPYGSGKTRVEVISKKAMATNLLARDWEGPVLDALSERLSRTTPGAKADAGAAGSRPAAPRIDDVSAVPFLRESGKDAYEKFLATRRRPRAFVVSEKGGWGWRTGPDALIEALRGCESHGQRCYAYAVDEKVVWTGPEAPTQK